MNFLAEMGYKPPSSKVWAKGVLLAALLVGALLAIPSIASATMAPPTYSSAFGSKGTGNGQFTNPYGIAADSAGNVWVTDTAQNRVQKFNSAGEYQCQIGSTGGGNGQFRSPTGIAADAAGNVWVVDRGNARVQEIGPNCEFLSKFGKFGEAAGQFALPQGIAIDPSGNIWVADTELNRIEKFSSAGTLLANCESKGSGLGFFFLPTTVASDGDGNIWVGEEGGRTLTEINKRCQAVASFKVSAEAKSRFFGMDKAGNIWVSHGGTVEGFYPEGEYFAAFGASGSGPGQFKNARSIASGPNGALWVVDAENDRIQKWTEGAPARVQTGRAASLGRTEAKLTGWVNPEGEATTYQFEYGTSTSFGQKVPTSGVSVGSGTTAVAVSQALSGLPGGTTYYYRVVATTGKGTINGETRHFTTYAPVKTGQMRIGGQTFGELGVTETPVSLQGTATIAFEGGGLEFPTLSCNESGSGVLTSTGLKSGTVTTSCKIINKGWEKCEVPPFKHSYSGSEVFGQIEFKNCPQWLTERVTLPAASFTYEYGSEAASFDVNVVGTTSFGTNPVTLSSNAHWALSEVKYFGVTLGYW
jgi:streptogramin lyase